MHDRLANFFIRLTLPLRPMWWRFMLMRKIKVRVFLRSGEHIDLLCSEWKVTTRDGRVASYSFDGIFNSIAIVPGEIIAVKELG